MDKRFKQQFNVTEKYIIPYIGKIPLDVLDIGCGEGGGLLPFWDCNCHVTGIDKSVEKIKYAKSYFDSDVKLLCTDIYNVISTKYDLVILKDTLEHIHSQKYFMYYLEKFLKKDSKIFITFSPWSMPFGGHQQCCKSFLRYIPYLHLMPFYEALLMRYEMPSLFEALLEIKETRLSVKRFRTMIEDYKIEKERYWLINPSYMRFGLKPVKFFNIRFLVTSYWCIISKK
jgi:SAM-dependent methyltransferase